MISRAQDNCHRWVASSHVVMQRFGLPLCGARLLVVTLLALTSACSIWHFGYPPEQWAAMTEQQKADVQTEYAQVLQGKQQLVSDNYIEARKDQIIKKGITGSPGTEPSIRPTY